MIDSPKPQAKESGRNDRIAATISELESYIEDLTDNSYLKREAAQRYLIAAGTDAVPLLLDAMQKGDLESIERASTALIEIGLECTPNDDGGAWNKLSALSKVTGGRTASAARHVVDEVGDYRAVQANQWLTRAGVFIGQRNFMIGAVSSPRIIVQINEDWNGDVDALQWLRWLRGVKNARVIGKGLRPDVLQHVFAMPKLKSLALVDGTLDEHALDGIKRQRMLDSLDIRYVRLSERQADQIAATPLRTSLTLMGTGVSSARVKAMSEATPGLKIEHRMGGFLGVKCNGNVQPCIIDDVIADSAADEAGLIGGDIILQIDEVEVSDFGDLQATINEHVPGDELAVKYRRASAINTVNLKLRRYIEEETQQYGRRIPSRPPRGFPMRPIPMPQIPIRQRAPRPVLPPVPNPQFFDRPLAPEQMKRIRPVPVPAPAPRRNR